MIKPKDIRSLTEFQRGLKASIARLKKSGRPELLTVNGKAAVVVQDSEAYFELVREADSRRLDQMIQVGIDAMEAGKVVPLKEAMKRIREQRRRNDEDQEHEAVMRGLAELGEGKGRPLGDFAEELKSRRAGPKARRKSA